jgi:rSAM/selenodomain-associated transferase 2
VEHLSIVIPVLNDAPALARLLGLLRSLQNNLIPDGIEIIVVDGGSTDDGRAVAEQHGCTVACTTASRGGQLQEGFARSKGQWIWLLHADSVPDAELLGWLVQPRGPCWGRFDVRFASDGALLKLVAGMMNRRSRLSGICTGDQGIFAHRALLASVGGVPRQPLMEDIELSKRLKGQMSPLCPRLQLTTSSRRWEQRGVIRTICVMWWFRLRYWFGADPQRLADQYYS